MGRKILKIIISLFILTVIFFSLTSLQKLQFTSVNKFAVELSKYKDYSVNYVKSFTDLSDSPSDENLKELNKNVLSSDLLETKNNLPLEAAKTNTSLIITCPSDITVNNDPGLCTAGAINTAGETICYNGDPSVIGSSTDASGGDGAIEYQWQSSTDSAFTTPVTIASNTSTYDPPANLAVSTWYRRQAKDGTCNT
ncbi:MAG: hypothetical protein Q8J84_05075, partial [Flavobacteriaceae bacterium]|nr:hypothetical protein [Flavobacteriaceae bacterium]